MVCIDRILVAVCRETETSFQVKRDKGCVEFPAGQEILIAGKNDKVLKINGPGLEHSHQLDPFQGLTIKGQAGGREHLFKQLKKDRQLHIGFKINQKIAKLKDDPGKCEKVFQLHFQGNHLVFHILDHIMHHVGKLHHRLGRLVALDQGQAVD